MVRRTLRVLAVVAVIAAISAAAAAIVATLRRRRTPAGAASDSPATTAHSSAPAPAPAPEPAPTPAPPNWLPAVDGVCPEGYPVKVNESSGIFHLPGGRFYARTIPDRCYTTSDAATADGYRQAKA